MPELPEIKNIAYQMNDTIKNKIICGFEFSNSKCLNITKEDFVKKVVGKAVTSIISKGKWLYIILNDESNVILCLGMGGEVIYHKSNDVTQIKHRGKISFNDGSCLTINFWWFGYLHYVGKYELHKPTDDLGIDALSSSFTPEVLFNITSHKKARIKNILLNQKIIAGIGNYYIHDILFTTKIHPLTLSNELSYDHIKKLYDSIQYYLKTSLSLGGADYEQDLFGNYGKYSVIEIAYKEGEPCPVCTTPIEKIKTGSTSSFVCSHCQLL